MTEINQLCAPILVYQEDVKENRATAQRKKETLKETSCAPSVQDRGLKMPTQMLEGEEKQDKGGAKSTRLTQQDSSQSLHRSEKLTDGVPKLVELYQYPRFLSNRPMPLPHNTAFCTVVNNVVRAQRHLVHKPRYKAMFQIILSSSVMEDFVTDCFWWLFMQNFQLDARIQGNIFTRMAVNYTKILTQEASCRCGSIFFREFPSTLAQTLYCCFCCSFPQSWSTIRSDAFLLPLCFTAYQWTGGICPAPDIFKKWDFEALEPEEATNVKLVSEDKRTEEESGSCLSLLENMFSSNSVDELLQSQPSSNTALTRKKSSSVQASSQVGSRAGSPTGSKLSSPSVRSNRSLVKQEKSGSDKITGTDLKALTCQSKQKLTRESHVAYPGTQFKRCVFNLYGNSPLVQFYMRMKSINQQAGLDGSVTYCDLLAWAQERSASHRADLRRMWSQYAQDLYVLNQKKLDECNKLVRKQKKILSQRTAVRKLCQLLLPDKSNEEDIRSHAQVTHAFETAVACLD
ncbi:protein FAM227A-like [Osmerus mordax]|uniref:protein FAM227A-like n=1 Tax=Osmerus mordax TaxID=8014 RepID=UPI00350EBA78